MKKMFFFQIFTLVLGMSLIACAGKKDETTNEGTVDPMETPGMEQAETGGAIDPSQPHYKCPNNCAGGTGDAKAPCPVCGTEMVHNSAYHQGGSTTPVNESTIQVNTNTPVTTGDGQPQASTPAPPPAQNAKGVYHFTCPNGCAGGAGAQGSCAKCGTALVHNQAYHNN
jgi:hypothetical protein